MDSTGSVTEGCQRYKGARGGLRLNDELASNDEVKEIANEFHAEPA